MFEATGVGDSPEKSQRATKYKTGALAAVNLGDVALAAIGLQPCGNSRSLTIAE